MAAAAARSYGGQTTTEVVGGAQICRSFGRPFGAGREREAKPTPGSPNGADMHRLIRRGLLFGAALSVAVPAAAMAATTVPGHTGSRTDADNNRISDAGVQVVGNYTDTYVDGDTVSSLRVNYKGDFGNTPSLDSGEIQNHYVCKGPGGNSTFNYEIVSNDDPRYTGNPDWAVWGTREYHVLTHGGQGNEADGGNGNLVGPYKV